MKKLCSYHPCCTNAFLQKHFAPFLLALAEVPTKSDLVAAAEKNSKAAAVQAAYKAFKMQLNLPDEG
jgi:hypothetical protein